MRRYTATAQDGRILSTTEVQFPQPGQKITEFPDSFDFETQTEWRIVGDTLVHEPLPAAVTQKDLHAQLATLDAKSIRPLRAAQAGTADERDREMLRQLETQAVALRAQLAATQAQGGVSNGMD